MKLLATVLLGLSKGEIANCTAEYLTLGLDCTGLSADGNSCDTTTHRCFTSPDCHTEFGCRLLDECPCGESIDNEKICLLCPEVTTSRPEMTTAPETLVEEPPFPEILRSFDCSVNEDFTLDLRMSTGFPRGRFLPDDREFCIVNSDTSSAVKEMVSSRNVVTGIYGNSGECSCPFDPSNNGPISFESCPDVFGNSKRLVQEDGENFTIWTFGIGFDDLFADNDWGASYLKYRGYSWEFECRIKTSGEVSVAAGQSIWERIIGNGVGEDELKFDLIALFEGNPVNDQVIEILEDDTRLLQFDLDVLEVSDKYMPFYKSCDLIFYNTEDIMRQTSETSLPNIINNGCVNPSYVSEFRMDTLDSLGRDVLTWFAPKIFETSGSQQTALLTCRVNGCTNFGVTGCTPDPQCASMYPVTRNNGSSEVVGGEAKAEMKMSGADTFTFSLSLIITLFVFN
ncbi:unnamed protein product [Oikopleura dioica]|uniref:ZP domain-containing protein n=1 Tax=Oikopleura dioica TaxID=34765 RepID=E4YJ17_OIKDI|nr:unnamed protein product [Oikopleura dioica]